MSEFITDYKNQKYYNKERKVHFLQSLEGINEKMNYTIFNRTFLTESFYEKDLCDFNMGEIEDLLFSLKSSSIAIIRIFLNFFAQYTQFCVENNYKQGTGINYYSLVSRDSKSLARFIDGDFKENRYLLPSQLDEVTSVYLINESDKLIFQMLWEGFSGKEFCELRLLKPEDVFSDELKINIKDENGKTIGQKYVTKRMIDFIEGTMEMDSFRTASPRIPVKYFQENGYVFKTAKSPRIPYGSPLSYYAIYQKYNMFIKALDMDYTKISSIGYSYSLYLGLLLKYVYPNIMDEDENFYRLLAGMQSRSFVTTGVVIKDKIEWNIQKQNLTKEDLEPDYITMYIKNLNLLRENIEKFTDVDKYIDMLKGLL